MTEQTEQTEQTRRYQFSRFPRASFGKQKDPSDPVGHCHCSCSLNEEFSKWRVHDGGNAMEAVLLFEIQFLSTSYYPIQKGEMSMKFSSSEPSGNQPTIKRIFPRSVTGKVISTPFI